MCVINRMIFFFILVMVLFTSCAERGVVIRECMDELPVVGERVLIDGDTVIVCHPEMFTDSIALPLSHFVEDLEIVPLETNDEAYVRSTGVYVTDNYFLLHSSRNMPF